MCTRRCISIKSDYLLLERIIYSMNCDLCFLIRLFFLSHSKVLCSNCAKWALVEAYYFWSCNAFFVAIVLLNDVPCTWAVAPMYCTAKVISAAQSLWLSFVRFRTCAIGLLFGLRRSHFLSFSRPLAITLISQTANSLWWHSAHRNALSIRMLY